MTRKLTQPLLLAFALLVISIAHAPPARSQDSEAEDRAAIEAGREALSDEPIPWYDAASDSLRAMPSRKVNRWWPDWWPDWDLDLGWLLSAFAYTLLGVALAAIVVLLVWFAITQRREFWKRRARPAAAGPAPVHVEVEALPFLGERPRDDLLGRARRHYAEGNYSEAIIYLFSYELVELDRSSRIQLAKGKTNRQYLRELTGVRPLRSVLERTLVAFEGVFFGRRELERAAFEACWNELPQFQHQLQVAAP